MTKSCFSPRYVFPGRVLTCLLLCGLLCGGLLVGPLAAQGNGAGYQTPPEVLSQIVTRPPTPGIQPSPDTATMLLLERPSLPSIAELAEDELRLAGMRFKPQNYGPSRRGPAVGMTFMGVADQVRKPVTGLPENPRFNNAEFSPDGQYVAFTHTRGDGIELWLAEVATAKARRLIDQDLNMVGFKGLEWTGDSEALLVTLRVGKGGPPEASPVPQGPVVQENLGEKAAARTYQDLLQSPHDEDVFEHFMTSQLVAVDLSGKITKLGEPAMYWGYNPSPDGRYIMVTTIERPFSYLVPVWRFANRVEILDRQGKVVRRVADVPLRESVPIGRDSVPAGPRNFQWRGDAPATLVWAEALDGGDGNMEAEHRDQLFVLAAPFGAEEATPWIKTTRRFGFIQWGHDDLALLYERWWKTRNERVSRLRPSDPAAPAELLYDRSYEDRYNDPGRPMTVTNEYGRRTLMTTGDGEVLYRTGAGASEEGDRPFLDTWNLKTGETERLFRSEAPYYEMPMAFLGEDGRRLVTRRETAETPPNFFVHDLKKGGEPTALTDFPHPAPELQGIQKELIKYDREDGVQLTANLYLPAGYDPAKDGPLPMVMWAYPREFKAADAAGQVRDSPYRFARLRASSPLLWLTQGYAVLDGAAMPIVGEGEEEPNDTFRKQLVANAKAAIDECVRRGVTERGRVAIGGHSYGAFMTANLLAHSDLFAAGIARSGAYNRSLTPFGFQSEERTFWEAPEIYFTMSPFMHAEKIKEPILLIHGDSDNNSGTFPIQSERFYHALKGHGATARLVMLPHESHGYRARESILHVLWETHQWLERYVKNGKITVEADTAPRGR